jgi:hypothetical protein
VLLLDRRPPHRKRSRVESPGKEQITGDKELRLNAPLTTVIPQLAPKMRVI